MAMKNALFWELREYNLGEFEKKFAEGCVVPISRADGLIIISICIDIAASPLPQRKLILVFAMPLTKSMRSLLQT